MKKIKTFADACKALKIKTTLPDVSLLDKEHHAPLIAHYKLLIIAKALNEGWKPNWNDDSEYKYFPYFRVKASDKKHSGFGFSYSDFDYWYSFTDVGSRLCFKSSELALYAANQFEDLYIEYFLYKN